MLWKVVIFFWILGKSSVNSFRYQIDEERTELVLSLVDKHSRIPNLKTLHNGFPVEVTVKGMFWSTTTKSQSSSIMNLITYLDGNVVHSRTVDLNGNGTQLPNTINAGEITSTGYGRRTIIVTLELNEQTASVKGEYESFPSYVTIIPLIVVFVLTALTHMVELSLLSALFIGSCIVAGNLKLGFYNAFEKYIIQEMTNEEHVLLYLFIFMMSGLVGMITKAGGFGGFGKTMSKLAKTSISGQLIVYSSGLLIFFDDYANSLIVGKSMRPLTDMMCISREKLAFIVDATSVTVASIMPISSWIGIEIGLIQKELDKITNMNDGDKLRISLNGLTVFLETVKYRYYTFFILFLIPLLAIGKRDFGPMLVAERKTQVYGRKDGGDGKVKMTESTDEENRPSDDTPERMWNVFIPISLLIFLISYHLIQSGVEPGIDQSIIDMLQNSSSFIALPYATLATIFLTFLFFHVQFKEKNESAIILPNPQVLRRYVLGWFKDNTESKVKPLMTVKESVDSLLLGMKNVFAVIVVLTMAWANGSMMASIGTDRFFADWILHDVSPGSLPTLSFVLSFIMSLATGSSWSSMTIIFPLISVPTYNASGGDPILFYSTLSGIFSGSIAGDHISPFSDSTILSALASECNLPAHVATQAPYVISIALVSMFVGTIPIGYKAYPNEVVYLVGILAIVLFVFKVAKPIIAQDGTFDVFMEMYLRWKPNSQLHELKRDTAQAFEALETKEKFSWLKLVPCRNDQTLSAIEQPNMEDDAECIP